MADIRLVRPEAGTNQAVACEPEAKFVFDFPTDAATLSRNGDNLVMTFEDGATLTLTDFYKAYSSKNMPSFEVDGAQVAGADFFAAMNEPDLMPAAGPGGRGAAGVGGARYHEYANMALYDGLDRLGGLDVGWPDGGYEPEIDGAAGRRGDEEGVAIAGNLNNIPTIGDNTTTPDPDDTNPDGLNPNTGSAIVVDEAAWAAQNQDLPAGREAGIGDRGHGYKGTGGFDVDLHGEGGTITVGGGAETGGCTITVENGTVTCTPGAGLTVNGVTVRDFKAELGDDGKVHVTYHYELDSNQPHNTPGSVGENDTLSGQIGIHVEDGSGDTADGSLRVEVHDDGPTVTAKNDAEDPATGNVLSGTLDMNFGADGMAMLEGTQTPDALTVVVDGKVYQGKPGSTGIVFKIPGGKLTIDGKGLTEFNGEPYTYEFTPDDPNKSGSLDFSFVVKDGDGDTATAKGAVKWNNQPKIDNHTTTPEGEGLTAGNGAIVVDEAAWANAHGGKGGSGDTTHGYTGTGGFDVELHGEGGTITLKDPNGETVTLSVDGEGNVTVPEGASLTVNGVTVSDFSATVDKTTGKTHVTYHYELEKNVTHPDHSKVGGEDKLADGKIDIHVEDGSGDKADGSISVEVHDDGPKLTVETKSLTQDNGVTIGENSNVTLHGQVKFSFGADAEGAKVYVKGSGEGAQFVEGEYDSEKGTYTFRLSEGTLTWDPEIGNFDCDLSRDQGSTQQDYTFTFKVEDSDGDSKEDTVTATVPRLDSNVDVTYEDVTKDGIGDSVAREAGVRGHGDPNNPNWQVWYDNESSDLHGSITLKGENEDPEGITRLNITGVTTHYSDTDVAHENQSYENSSPSDNLPSLGEQGGQSGITLYVVKDDNDQFTVTDKQPADNEYYGKLYMRPGESGSVDWNFHLNTDNPDLLNSLNEGEQIDVQLQFSVNEGGAKQKGTLEFSIKGTDDLPQVQADFSVNPGAAAGRDAAHVEDAGVTDVWGWSGTFRLPAGKGAPTGDYNEFVGVPGFGIRFNVGDEECLFFQQWFRNGWGSADFVLKNGSIFHVEVTEQSPDGWKFSYSITPGKDQLGSENGGQCPEINVYLQDQKQEDEWHPVGKVTSPGGPNKYGLTVYSSDISFNAAERHVPSAEEGRLEDYDPRGDRSQQLESGTHGNKENTPWEGIPVVRLGIKATDPDADGGSGRDNLFTVNEDGLNDGFQHNAKVGFQGWDKNLYTWGSPEEFKAVWDDCEQYGWKIGYKPQHVEEGQFNGMPGGDYLVHEADYGFFFIDKWGNIFYVLDTRDGSAADKLREGAYVNDVREFVVQDEHGAWSSDYFGVTVKGANEAPEITDVTYKEGTLDAEGHPVVRALGDNITKDSLNQATLTGTVAAKDRDVTGLNEQGNDVTEKVEYFLVDKDGNLVDSVQTEHGRVTIDPVTGEFTYTLDSTDDSVTHLKQYNEEAEYHGEGVDSLTDEFFVGARDPHGAVDIKKQEVTIKGTNSTPHIESVTDDGSDDGLSFQLKEAGVKVGADVGGDEGNNYTVKDEGRSVLKGSVKADDINDANNPDQVENKLTYSFTVDGGTAGEAGDAPHPAPEGFTHYVVTDYGVLWYNEKGDYQYELDPDKTNSLSEGQIVEQKVTVTVTDDAEATDTREFTVQIVGTNDAPQFVGDDSKTPLADGQSVELKKGENGQYSAHLQAVDPDKDGEGNVDYTFKGELAEGKPGSPNPGINQSQSFATDLGTFSIADEHTGTVTFTANPTSDLMEAARAHLRTFFTKDETGELELNDAGQKALESGFIEQVHEGGGLNFTKEGWQEWLKGIKDNSELKEWLEKNNAEITDEGDLVVHADVYAVDQYGAADTVDVTVELAPPSVPGNGPELKMPDSLTYGDLNVRESGQVTDKTIDSYGQKDSSGVTLEFTEPKEPQDKNLYGFTFIPKNSDGEKGEDIPLTGSRQSIETPYGTLTINPDTGEVEFVLDNSSADVQRLKDQDGDRFLDAIEGKLKEYFEDYSIVVYEKSNPSNNREFPLDGSGTGDEGKAGTLEGPELNIYGAETPPELTVDPVLDIDLADTSNSDKKDEGKATTRDLDSEGDRGTLTYSVTDDSGDLKEGTDENGWKTYTNEYGTFHLNEETGEYSFTADGEAAKELPVGESWTGQFTITVTDDSGQSDSQEVTVQVHGANDVPEITEPTEDKLTVQDTDNAPGKVLDGKLEATDPDKGDTNLTWSVADEDGNPAGSSVETAHGTFTVNPDGSYTFESNGKAKESVQDKVTVVVDDGHGGRTTQELIFDIEGVDDKVVFEGEGGTVTLSQLGAGVTTTTGQLAVHDLDDNVTLQGTVSFDSYEWTYDDKKGDWVQGAKQDVTWNDDGSIVVHGQYGDLTVYEDGHYTYSVKPGVSDKLWRDKRDLTDTFNVHIQGAEQEDQTLEFTIDYDQNNKPEIHAESQNSTQGSFTLKDADNDTLWYMPEAKFDGMDVRVEQKKTDATEGWSEYWAQAESDSSSWTLYGVDAETHEEVVLGELTITKSENGNYSYNFTQDKNWDHAGSLEVDLRVYDSHNAVTGDLFTAELSDQAKAEDDTISLTGLEDAQASLFSVDALSDEDGEGVFSDTDEALSGESAAALYADAGDAGADAYAGVMDSLSPASWEDPQDQAAGQSALDNDLFNGDQEFGTPDDELIVYNATDYAVFGGGDGIDVLLSKNSPDTLDDLLGTPLGGQDRPHVENVELFLKGTGTDAEGNTFSVEDLTSLSDLAEKAGITVDNASGTVTLDDRWEKTDDGTYASKDGLTLETTLADVTPKSTDAAATQAANEILLTQQG